MSVPVEIIRDSSVNKISSFGDLIKLMDFVYATVPWGDVQDNGWMKETWQYQRENIVDTYYRFKKGKLIGWCGGCAQLFSLLLSMYGIKNYGYNYGISSAKLSHVGIVADLDGMSFFLDPYFNRYYSYQGEFPLQFSDLLRLIQERKTSCIKSIYGSSHKRMIIEKGKEEKKDPRSFEGLIMEFFISKGIKEKSVDIFGEYDPLYLFQIRIL